MNKANGLTSSTTFVIDAIKINHWLNARKITTPMIAKNNKKLVTKILKKKDFSANYKEINFLTKILNISSSEITKKENLPEYILYSKRKILQSKRAVRRDGIHFYNYYTLPSPQNFIAPVILDICCPKEKMPKLNKGHLEQAITINIGKEDMYGRWGIKSNKQNFRKFRFNKGKASWIIGDSYVEPSYCPHTYSLTGKEKSQILSYTAKCPLQRFIDNSNSWPNTSYKNFLSMTENLAEKLSFLDIYLKNRGVDKHYLSKRLNVDVSKLKNIINKKGKQVKLIKKICNVLNLDYELFLDKNFKSDSVGKNYMSYNQSIKTIRKFKSYYVASMASSLRYPDLYGLYFKIVNDKKVLDLIDYASVHYYVTKGRLSFYINNKKINVNEGDALWVAPYTKHGFSGKGSLIKLSNGEAMDNSNMFEISKVFKPKYTLRRMYKDLKTWGYDR